MTQLHTALVTPGGEDLNTLLGVIDDSLGQVLEARADVGARQNRVEMMDNRLGDSKCSGDKATVGK